MGNCVSKEPKRYKIDRVSDHMFKVGGSFGRGDVSLELHAEIGCRSKRSYGKIITLPIEPPESNVVDVQQDD